MTDRLGHGGTEDGRAAAVLMLIIGFVACDPLTSPPPQPAPAP